jgi:hypothetical protein
MNSTKWEASVDGEDTILVRIDNDVNIDNLILILIDEFRHPILKIDIDKRIFSLSIDTKSPIFAQIENSVKYVKGSGGNSYNNTIKKS